MCLCFVCLVNRYASLPAHRPALSDVSDVRAHQPMPAASASDAILLIGLAAAGISGESRVDGHKMMLVSLSMSTSMKMPAPNLEALTVHSQHGHVCRRAARDGGTSESNVCVRACVRDGDGSESAVAGNKAGPTPQWWWLSIQGRLQCALVRGQPLDEPGGDDRPGAVGQKRSTDVGVPRHTPWTSSKTHSAVDGSEGRA